MVGKWRRWFFASRRRQRIAIKAWRIVLRLQRATLARVVLIARRSDGAVLVLSTDSNELMLPAKNLNGWEVVTTQVEDLLRQTLGQHQTPRLIAIQGTPSPAGVTFLFSAEISAPVLNRAESKWLHASIIPPLLSPSDRELLLLEDDR